MPFKFIFILFFIFHINLVELSVSSVILLLCFIPCHYIRFWSAIQGLNEWFLKPNRTDHYSVKWELNKWMIYYWMIYQTISHWQIKIGSETINNNAKYLILNTQADVFKKQFSDAVAAAISKIGCHVPSLVSICCCILFHPAYSPWLLLGCVNLRRL